MPHTLDRSDSRLLWGDSMADEVTYWIGVDGDFPTNPEFIDKPKILEDQPYAIWAFQQDDLINLGYPYHVLVPDMVRITLNPVKQREYICVYDMLSTKPDLMTNGLAILDPTSAIVHEIINGEYSLTMEHPIDDAGKWRFIRESNLIKCLGQIYTIKRVEWNHSSENSGTLTAYCEHIFYQLNDLWIFGNDYRNPERYAYCISAMNRIMSIYVSRDEGAMYRFAYDWSSDWEWYPNSWTMIIDGEGQTPVEKLIGSGGIIDEMGGELYRDNFHFSINERMEGAEDNAFDLRFGENLSGMTRTIDTSTLALWFGLRDEVTGCFGAIAWDGTAWPQMQFPHNIVRSGSIRYEDDYYEAVRSGDANIWDRLMPDVFATWKKTATPIVCYDLSVVDLKNIYPELSNHYKFKVGNSGTIYDTLLGGKVTLKITETETDGITGEVKRVVFGSKNSFTRGAGYPLEFNQEPEESTYDLPLHDKRKYLLYDRRGKQLKRRGVFE